MDTARRQHDIDRETVYIEKIDIGQHKWHWRPIFGLVYNHLCHGYVFNWNDVSGLKAMFNKKNIPLHKAAEQTEQARIAKEKQEAEEAARIEAMKPDRVKLQALAKRIDNNDRQV